MKAPAFLRFVARGIVLCWRAGKGLFLAGALSSMAAAAIVPLQILLLAATVDLVAGVAGAVPVVGTVVILPLVESVTCN